MSDKPTAKPRTRVRRSARKLGLAHRRTNPPSKEELHEAAVALGKKFLRKYGKAHMAVLAGRGGTKAWEGWSPEEIRLEMRRRSAVARQRRAARIKAAIEQGTGR